MRFFALHFFRLSPLRDLCAYALTMLALGWLLVHGAETSGYTWQWSRVSAFFLRPDGSWGPLLHGLGLTVILSALGLLGATGVALMTVLLRLSRSWLGQALARIYLETIRNTPLLVQIFFIYFVFAPWIGLGRMASAVLALSLFEGAYASEVLRASILAIPKGQWEAAQSLGMPRFSVYTQVILPQAVRLALPPLTSQGVSLIKDSALVSTIAIMDLTMQAQIIVAETFLSFEIWFTVAALYLLLTGTVSLLARQLENKR
ncbi:MAG: amino acid ABC transporter permease [Desulfovibrionales bacterium]|nr:amino acid ABC transporter permease [Desulfovibrionales bacterium]